MRILAVDAGNTRIKWGLHAQGSWQVQGWAETARPAALVRAWSGLEPPDAIVATNVAGARVAKVLASAARRLKRHLRYVRSAARQAGVSNSYDNPAQLGADRWAALIGARYIHPGPCVVVGAGTTVTIDALSGDGVFLGGMIIPGAGLMRGALARHTAGLRPRGGRYAFFPARTADAIESGGVNALVGAIERMRRFMQETGQSAPLTLISGGDARLLAPHLNGTVEVVDNLVLEGIVRIALDRTP